MPPTKLQPAKRSGPTTPPTSKPGANRTLMVVTLLAVVLVAGVAWFLYPKAGEVRAPPPAGPAANRINPGAAVAPPADAAPAEPLAAETTPAAPAEKTPLDTPEERAVAMAALLMKPADTAASAQLVKDWIEANYQPLYAQLNLSTSDATTLGNLLTDRLEAIRAGLAAAATPGSDGLMTAQQINAVSGVIIPPFEQQISQFLGPERYQAYQTYAAPMRSLIIESIQQVRP